MAKPIFANNASGFLIRDVAPGDPVLPVADAAVFPAVPANGFYRATLSLRNSLGNETAWEIVRVIAKDGDELSVERGREGTRARSWPAGTPVGLRLTAGALDDFWAEDERLAGLIADEAAARTGADERLRDATTAETAAREAAILAEQTARAGADNALDLALAAETDVRAAAVSGLAASHEAAIGEVKRRIDAQEGLGGYLTANDFGTDAPPQAALTAYAKSDIWGNPASGHADGDIFNGTRVVNLFDGYVWILANTPGTSPPVFGWEKAGLFNVSDASRETAGVVRLAAAAEVAAGVDDRKAVTAFAMNAVRQAAESAQLAADSASALAESAKTAADRALAKIADFGAGGLPVGVTAYLTFYNGYPTVPIGGTVTVNNFSARYLIVIPRYYALSDEAGSAAGLVTVDPPNGSVWRNIDQYPMRQDGNPALCQRIG